MPAGANIWKKHLLFGCWTIIVTALLLSVQAAILPPDSANYSWKPIRIGAGGWCTGIDIAPDGTKVIRTDTYGAYLWNGTQWQQLVTSTRMPAVDVTTNNGAGVYEIRIAPSNSSRFYMFYNGRIYRSDNKGEAWTRTSFTPVTGSDANDNFRINGFKMAVDPINPDVVYAGTTNNGVWGTSNAGASWTQVTAIPAGTNSQGGMTGIAFDQTSGQTAGKTNIIYIGSWGNGVYRSVDAGLTWAKTAGGPTTVHHAIVAGDGIYYAVDGTAAWKFGTGTWATINSTGGWHSVAIDPANPGRIVLGSDAGTLNQSLDRGATWGGSIWGATAHPITRAAADIPWLAWTNESYMSNGDMVFDPLSSDKLYFSEGIGVWYTDLSPSQAWNVGPVWNSQNIGIEQLCPNQIIAPPGGKPVCASWDRALFYINNPDVFPSTHGFDNSHAIVAGWAEDFASADPTFLAALADWGGVEQTCYSTDGGQHWTLFPTFPAWSQADWPMGGSIAASTPDNIVWVPANKKAPYFTKNRGTTWTKVILPAVADDATDAGWGQLDFAYYLNRHIIAADRVTAGTFYLYHAGFGLFRSTDGGSNWSLVHSGQVASWSYYNAEMKSVPGKAGHLFFTAGISSGNDKGRVFMHSVDGGTTWDTIPNVAEVYSFGFGKEAPASSYPSVYIAGWVSDIWGVWRSDNEGKDWTLLCQWPIGSLDAIKTVEGDKDIFGKIYVGFSGSGYAYGQISNAAVRNAGIAPAAGQTLLLSAGPNPLSRRTVISYVLNTATAVSMCITDAKGCVVRTLVGEEQKAGAHSVMWDGQDRTMNPVANGVYYCHAVLGGCTVSRKLVVSR